MVSISDLPDDPQYTIKTVCAQTGIRPVTLRAWERRYKLLNPRRAQNQYRRYSQREVALLRWVKTRIDEGISISSVVNELNGMLARGSWPDIVPMLQLSPGRIKTAPPHETARELYEALVCHDEPQAAQIMREVQTSLDLTTICLEVITPCLIEIGEGWFRGELSITTEHFASGYLRGWLMSVFQTFTSRRGAPYILTGCAPDEHHEIGVLIFSTLLRNQGYRVEYLGQDVPLADLVDYAADEEPAIICLGASTTAPALNLATFQEKLSALKSAPLFVYGGQAFHGDAALRSKTPGIYLGDNAHEAVAKIGKLI